MIEDEILKDLANDLTDYGWDYEILPTNDANYYDNEHPNMVRMYCEQYPVLGTLELNLYLNKDKDGLEYRYDGGEAQVTNPEWLFIEVMSAYQRLYGETQSILISERHQHQVEMEKLENNILDNFDNQKYAYKKALERVRILLEQGKIEGAMTIIGIALGQDNEQRNNNKDE